MQLEHLLTDEQKSIREMVRKFVAKEILPIREKLEEDYSLVERVHQKLVDLGIQRVGYPAEYGGGLGPGARTTSIIIREELARGDAGIALISGINGGAILAPAIGAGNKAILDRFVPAFCGDKLHYACLSMTDAASGADTENPVLKWRGIATRARLDGDEYVINGTKSWPSNAGLASVYMTVCTTDPNAGDDGIAIIYVPRDAKGLSFGKPETKLGFRTCINASVYYDNVRVPKEYRVAGPGKDALFYHALAGCGSPFHNGAIALGIAQAAFDIVLEYTKERESGGKPVREWSLAAGILADMAIRVEMTRAAIYNMAWMLDHPDVYPPAYSASMISKGNVVRVFAADTAVYITNKGIELMGSNGLSPEYHMEKYLRDSKITQTILAGQQVSLYRVIRGYYDYVV
jgi:alkylation response protein AidB-like acyl-CoA dehydrogenase